MDLISQLQIEKDMLGSLVRKYTSEQMYAWYRNSTDILIKKCVVLKDVQFKCQAVSCLSILYKFYKKSKSEDTGNWICFSLYIVLLQLEVLVKGNEVESFPEFPQYFDLDDWSLVTLKDLQRWDFIASQKVIYDWSRQAPIKIDIIGISTVLTLLRLYKVSYETDEKLILEDVNHDEKE